MLLKRAIKRRKLPGSNVLADTNLIVRKRHRFVLGGSQKGGGGKVGVEGQKARDRG